VLVLGAGVAGLQAIATARRLGAVVEAFDTRPVVKEQVQSLGGKFLEIELGEQGEGTGGYAKELSEEAHRKEQELVGKHVKDADVVITTALVPGRRAPILVTADMVKAMKPGSVIVDLAAEMGGNCELTSPGETVVREGVTIVGEVNLPSTVAVHASQLYARNVGALLGLLVKDGTLALDLEDEIINGALITHQGEVVHPATKAALEKA
jgi:NAD(P) transhydrogenase subunit alpha